MTEQAPPKAAPIYVSYLTFTNLLDWLRDLGTLPSQFDRSFWGHKFSGSGGAQLMSGLRFLGLLDGDMPTQRLEQLALASNEERRELLKKLLDDAYGHDFISALPKSTPKLVNERLQALGTTDATHAKARSFFVNAAKAVGLPMQPQVAKQARNRPTLARKSGTRRTAEPEKVTSPVRDQRSSGAVETQPEGLFSDLNPTLRTLIVDLPLITPTWTRAKREAWKATFLQVLDYAYPPIDDEAKEGQ